MIELYLKIVENGQEFKAAHLDGKSRNLNDLELMLFKSGPEYVYVPGIFEKNLVTATHRKTSDSTFIGYYNDNLRKFKVDSNGEPYRRLVYLEID